MNDVALNQCKVDHLGEGVTDLVYAIIQSEQTDFAVTQMVGVRAHERKDGITKLHTKLAGSLAHRAYHDFFNAIDHREPQRTPSAVDAAEEKNWRGLRSQVRRRRFCNSGGALLRFELDPADTSASPAGSNSRIGLPSSARVVPA